MNIIHRFFCLVLLVFLYSCNCKDTIHCPTLSAEAQEWMPFNLNDSIKFVNDLGDRYRFGAYSKTLSQPYDAQACKGSFPLCSCDKQCHATGRLQFRADSAGISINIEEGSMEGASSSSFTVDYDLFGFSHKLKPTDPISVTPYDSLLSSITLGSHTYQDIYMNAIDTMQTYNQNAKVWKVYYSKTMSVVGFWHRPTQTVFYRE